MEKRKFVVRTKTAWLSFLDEAIQDSAQYGGETQ